MGKPPDTSNRKLAVNRAAMRDYLVLERIEAGIELRGTEVKSAKNSHLSLAGSFARVHGTEIVLNNLNIEQYDHGNRFNHKPDRQRRLLLHRSEIRKLQVQTEQKGLSVIPLSIYLKKGLIKVEIGVCKGKRKHDKREEMRRKTADREAARAIAGKR